MKPETKNDIRLHYTSALVEQIYEKLNQGNFGMPLKSFMHCKRNTTHDSIHLKEDSAPITEKLEVAEVN